MIGPGVVSSVRRQGLRLNCWSLLAGPPSPVDRRAPRTRGTGRNATGGGGRTTVAETDPSSVALASRPSLDSIVTRCPELTASSRYLAIDAPNGLIAGAGSPSRIMWSLGMRVYGTFLWLFAESCG